MEQEILVGTFFLSAYITYSVLELFWLKQKGPGVQQVAQTQMPVGNRQDGDLL